MLLSPPQRTARAGFLFASALALAMIRCGWKLQIQPAVFRMWRGDEQFNPFDAINKLMAAKLSRQDWQARCSALEISELLLLCDPEEAAVQLQAEMFSVDTSKT